MHVVFWGMPHHSPVVDAHLGALPDTRLTSVATEVDLIAAVGTADVLVLTANRYTEAVERAVLAAKRLQLLQLLSAGYELLLGRRLPAKTVVATAGDSLAPAVAEHALALVLALRRRLPAAILQQAGQSWDREPFGGVEALADMRAAVIGFGAIGRAVARRLRAFDVVVTGISRRGLPEPGADIMAPLAALDEVLAASDLAIITLPGTPETAGLFDRDRLRRCRPDALLVNVARGRIVDALALAEALDAGRLGGAGLDVTDPEPLPPGHPLWRARNVIITPHYGGIGGQRRLAEFVAENLRRLRRGQPPAAMVDIALAAGAPLTRSRA